MKRIPPWLVFLAVAAVAAGLRLGGFAPPGTPQAYLQIAGAACGLISIGLGAMSVRALLAYDGENPVTGGIFRFSRHPMYLAMLGVVAAAGLVTAEWVVLGAVPVLALGIDVFVIRPEEAELREVFGQAYIEYTKRVRRWM